MKKSDLRKLIKDTIKEQISGPGLYTGNPPIDSEAPDIQVAQASSLYINNSSGMNQVPNGGYSIRCPEGYTFEGYEEDTTPGDITVDAANTPASGFVVLASNPMFIISRCIKKVGTSLVSTGQPQRHRCDAVKGCVPSSTGPFASLEECEKAGCGDERGDRDTQTLDPVNQFVGNTGRPSPGGPLEEIVEKIAKKLKIKE